MTSDSDQHHRRSIRLPAYDYSAPGAYFITIVTHGRICLFGDVINGQMRLSDRGLIAEDCWRDIPDHFPHIELGAFVVMPNHIHGILILHDRADGAAIVSPPVGATQWVAPTTGGVNPTRPNGPKRGSVGAIIGAYKMAVTRAVVRRFGGVPHIWQRNYYEHVVRDDEDHNRIYLYIESNIVNWAEDEENPMR
jgi:putative transposase